MPKPHGRETADSSLGNLIQLPILHRNYLHPYLRILELPLRVTRLRNSAPFDLYGLCVGV